LPDSGRPPWRDAQAEECAGLILRTSGTLDAGLHWQLPEKPMTAIYEKEIKETVRDFILSSINIQDLRDDDNLFESGIVNSLFAVQLMTYIEKTFAIEVGMDDLDIENFKSINATTTFVLTKNGG
jgi:acyl carrier protein